MTVPSGYVPSGDSQTRLINTILAIAKLQEQQATNKVANAYRESQRIKTEQDTQKMYDESREKNIVKQTEALFGDKYDPEMEPALAPARRALADPYSTITAPVGGAMPTMGTTETGDIGNVRMPNLVNRPATINDVSTLARHGAEAIRQTSLAKLESLGYKKDDPRYKYYSESPQILLPGKVIPESETGSKAIQQRVKAETDVETQPAEVARIQAASRQQVATAAKSDLELTRELIASQYYSQNAAAEAKLKNNQALISDAELKRQPDLAQKLRLENEQLEGNIHKNKLEIAQTEHILGLMDAYHKTSDPAVQEKIYRDIAVARGQTPALLTHDLQTKKAVLDATTEAIKLRATGQTQFANKQYEEGMASYDAANRHEIEAAKLNKSPTVQIVVPQRNYRFWGSETTPTVGRAKTDTRRAEMFVSGRIDEVAIGKRIPTGKMIRLEPGLDPEPEFYDQADGVAWKAYYENLAVATDIKEITKVINGYNIPPEMKERALLKYQAIRGGMPNEAVVVEPPARATSQLGLKPLSEEERKVPRNWAGGVSQPTRGFMAPPASSTGQLPEGTTVGLPESAKLKPASKEQNRAQFTPIINAAADKYGIDKALFHRLIDRESQYNPYVKSQKGAIGLAQLMPKTAEELNVDPTNPRQNVEGGARYLRQLLDRYNGDMRKALIAYNWGMGNFERGGSMPAETEAYVAAIMR